MFLDVLLTKIMKLTKKKNEGIRKYSQESLELFTTLYLCVCACVRVCACVCLCRFY